MKTIQKLLVAVILLIPFISFAQTDTTKRKVKTNIGLRHEFNFGITDLASKNSFQNFWDWIYMYDYIDYSYYYYPSFYDSDTKNYGFGYKFSFDKFALRAKVGFNYSSNKTDYVDSDKDTHEIEISQTSIIGSLGIQRNFDIDKFRFFIGVDLKTSAFVLEHKDKYTDVSISNPAYNHTDDYKYDLQKYQYGGGPLFGLQYQIIPRLSLSLESSIDFYITQEDYKYTHTCTNSPTYTGKSGDNGMQIKFTPLAFLSANFHF
ncbi:MAG: hypothetical protein V2A54_10615 [Bacteroidota bacterium]